MGCRLVGIVGIVEGWQGTYIVDYSCYNIFILLGVPKRKELYIDIARPLKIQRESKYVVKIKKMAGGSKNIMT